MPLTGKASTIPFKLALYYLSNIPMIFVRYIIMQLIIVNFFFLKNEVKLI